MEKTLRHKSTSLAVKDLDGKEGIVTLYASAFGNVDHDGDIVRQGAFRKTLQERGPGGKGLIFHLYQHNTTQILGKPMHMEEDDKGLLVRSKIVDTSLGKDVMKLYEAGIITQHSIGFVPEKFEIDKEAGTVTMTEIKLFEYSSVTWGANEMTPTVDVKGLDKDSIVKQIGAVQKALTNGTFTDTTFVVLEGYLEQLKGYIVALEARQPAQTTAIVTEPQEWESVAKGLEQFIQRLKN